MNKRIASISWILNIVFFCNQNAFAQKTVVGTKEIPLEVNLLIESLQSQSPDNFKLVYPIAMSIDQYARSMSKEDVFLIGKIEVYKTLLKNYETAVKTPVDGATVATLRLALTKVDDNFTKWFLQALLKDVLELTKSPTYKEFLLLKNNNSKIEKLEYKRLEKKAELIQYWISRITPEAPDFPLSLREALAPKMMEALKNIQNSFNLIASEASMTPIAPKLKEESELKFFTIKEIVVKDSPVAKKEKSVEEILAPVTDTPQPQDLPLPSQESWLEDENTPPSLQNLPKPSDDADWLQDF